MTTSRASTRGSPAQFSGPLFDLDPILTVSDVGNGLDLFLLCTDWVTVFGERFVMMKEGDPTDETAAAPQIVFVQN